MIIMYRDVFVVINKRFSGSHIVLVFGLLLWKSEGNGVRMETANSDYEHKTIDKSATLLMEYWGTSV